MAKKISSKVYLSTNIFTIMDVVWNNKLKKKKYPNFKMAKKFSSKVYLSTNIFTIMDVVWNI